MKFERFSLKILKIKEVRRHGRRGVGRNAVPPSYCFLSFFSVMPLWSSDDAELLCGAKGFRTVLAGFKIFQNVFHQIIRSGPLPLPYSLVAHSSSVRTANRRTDFLRTRIDFSEKKRKSTASREPLWLNSTI